MIEVDWGNLRPTPDERTSVERRLSVLSHLGRSVVFLRRHGSGYEARLRMSVSEETTELRLQDENVGAAVDRLVQLLTIVSRERTAH